MAVMGQTQNHVLEFPVQNRLDVFEVSGKNTALLHLRSVCFAPLKQYDCISYLGRATNVKLNLRSICFGLKAVHWLVRGQHVSYSGGR